MCGRGLPRKASKRPGGPVSGSPQCTPPSQSRLASTHCTPTSESRLVPAAAAAATAAQTPQLAPVASTEVMSTPCNEEVKQTVKAAVNLEEKAASLPPSDQECPVCHEQLKVPKILPCGHLLCRQCLLSWLKRHPQATCPMCRCTIIQPVDRSSTFGKGLEEAVDELPTELVTEAFIQGQQLLQQGHQCQACQVQAAASLCVTCGDFFCSPCAAGHKRSTATRHHHIEALSSLTAGKLISSRPVLCSAHEDEVSKVFCPSHRASICLLCATTEHRHCPQVTTLEAKRDASQAELNRLMAVLIKGETGLEDAIKDLDKHAHATEEYINSKMKQLKNVSNCLKSAVDLRVNVFSKQLLKASSTVKEAVDEGKSSLLQRKAKLTLHKRLIERIKETPTIEPVFQMSSQLTKRVAELDCSPILPSDAKPISSVIVDMDEDAMSRLEREILHFGQVKHGNPITPAGKTELGRLRFHNNCGSKVTVSEDGMKATSFGSGSGIVMSQDPMKLNQLYEIRVDLTDARWKFQYPLLGVVTENPATILRLPNYSFDLTSGVVISHNIVKTAEGQIAYKTGLQEVRDGDTVSLALDSSHSLHLFINVKHQGQVATNLHKPCYFFVDLHACWKQVTALPVRHWQ